MSAALPSAPSALHGEAEAFRRARLMEPMGYANSGCGFITLIHSLLAGEQMIRGISGELPENLRTRLPQIAEELKSRCLSRCPRFVYV